MNERIRLLAEQAGLKVNADGEIGPAFFGSIDAGYKKFAELIVRECIANCDDLNSMKYIADHFGIKIEGLE